ncbi:MFS transporter [Microlunatus parietis]|uniref:DHA1 family purine ribonucleoside efflux pump-like MFS transporter n=1 Tax=Microlunatus parietis TaxID=682979 RepID=A0A7Y9I2A2_9ACTN|nr:MFS transporter [Microlunatus parietis]NYE68919.1 DHA1 family purine ribonucleoside efflux pump-like MFS transporter [Microlunatus parietis]
MTTQCQPPSAGPQTATSERPVAAWAPIVALALGIAILVASEFLPASVLPAMAADLGVSEGVAGLAVAATALAGALTAPTIALLLPRTDRRVVLIGLLVAAALSNLVVAVAPSFVVLLIGRLVLGAAIAGYWSFAFGAGTAAVPGRDHVVSASLAVGVSVATIVAVPLASAAGDVTGWRVVFLVAAGFAAVATVIVIMTLPSVTPHPSAGLAMLRRALANRRLLAGVGCIVLVAFGNFAAYPYIRLAIERIVPGGGWWLLLVWGVGGLVGNLAAGALTRRLRVAVVAAPVLLGLGLVLTMIASGPVVLVVGVVLWGVGFNMVPVATQLWVTRVEPERAESALSLQVTAFQVAITLGSAVGGAVLDRSSVGVVLLVGAGLALASGIGFLLLRSARV